MNEKLDAYTRDLRQMNNLKPKEEWNILELAKAYESGELGMDERYMVPTTEEEDRELDDALDLKLISIRLEKHLLVAYDTIGSVRRKIPIGMMEEALRSFAQAQLEIIGRECEDREASELAATIAQTRRADGFLPK